MGLSNFRLSLSGISSAYIMTNYGLINAIAFIGFLFLAGVLLSIFERNKQINTFRLEPRLILTNYLHSNLKILSFLLLRLLIKNIFFINFILYYLKSCFGYTFLINSHIFIQIMLTGNHST